MKQFIDSILKPLDLHKYSAIFLKHIDSVIVLLGIHIGGSGEIHIRLRPSLIFQSHHAEIFLDKFDQVLRENN